MTQLTNQPTAVILDLEEDGQRGEMELVFPTRWQAEWFMFQLPMMGIVAVKGAIISPLVEVHV